MAKEFFATSPARCSSNYQSHPTSFLVVAEVERLEVLVAVVVFSLAGVFPGVLPWALGFAVGALLYLLLAELLPESYEQAGHTSIALVTLLAMGIVVALGGQG